MATVFQNQDANSRYVGLVGLQHVKEGNGKQTIGCSPITHTSKRVGQTRLQELDNERREIKQSIKSLESALKALDGSKSKPRTQPPPTSKTPDN